MIPDADLRQVPHEALSRLRHRVVQAVLRGAVQERVAERFRLRPATVSAWMVRFRNGGAAALRDRSRGRPAVVPGDGLWLRGVLGQPPKGAPLWTMNTAVEALLGAGGRVSDEVACRRHLVRQGILPGALVSWARSALVDRPKNAHRYLAIASVQGFDPEGWTFSLVQATGRLAFLVQEGPLRLARWIGFLERVDRHLAGRSAVLLVHPPELAVRPGVLRWLASRRPGFTLAGVPSLP